MTPKTGLLLMVVSLLLPSCGYQWGSNHVFREAGCISVPYARGDTYGFLTDYVVHELGASGLPAYSHRSGRYRLKICLMEPHESVIGYRYDQKGERGEIERRVIPTERRVSIAAEIEVVDCVSQCILLGPFLVEASVSYDFDSYSNHSSVNIFSLGQLNDSDVSRDVVIKPLYRELAHRIVDFLSHAW